MSTRVEDRFWSKVDRRGPDECWLWTGGRTGRSGYGRFHHEGRGVVAHRFAYERFVGTIPAGLQIDHLCRTRLCVNPAHLEPVTNRENVLRGLAATRTHCAKGHPVIDGRSCGVCVAATKRRWDQKHRADPSFMERRRAQERERYRRNMADPEWRARKQAKERAGHRRRKEFGSSR